MDPLSNGRISPSLRMLTDNAYTEDSPHLLPIPFFAVELARRPIQLEGGGAPSRFLGRSLGSPIGRTFYSTLVKLLMIFHHDGAGV